MDKRVLQLLQAPTQVYLVITSAENSFRVSPFTWIMPVSYNPPKIVIAMRPDSKSLENIMTEGRFFRVVKMRDDKSITQQIRLSTQVNQDYSLTSNDIFVFTVPRKEPPRIKDSYQLGDVLCKKIDSRIVGDHFLLTSQVLKSNGLSIIDEDETKESLQYVSYKTFASPRRGLFKVKGY